MTARERIQKVTDQWFLIEPLFFSVYCTHQLAINPNIMCPLRTGKGRIEYNPELINAVNERGLANMLGVEMIRILLGHPYSRRPTGCKPVVLHKASDMVIAPAYPTISANMALPAEAGLPEGKSYEWYISRLKEKFQHKDGNNPSEGDTNGNPDKNSDSESQDDNRQKEDNGHEDSPNTGESEESEKSDDFEKPDGSEKSDVPEMSEKSEKCEKSEKSEKTDKSDGSCNSDDSTNLINSTNRISSSNRNRPGDTEDLCEADYTALWEEDQFVEQIIKELIQSTTQWGSVPLGMVELIRKAAEGKIDYRNVLRMFRSSILSQQRHLTRMRPSRRFGFEQMGSRYEFTTKLLIAIDTSGSVGSEDLGRYLRVITSFFKYGIQEISILMFDYVVQGEPVVFKSKDKNKRELKVKGRGGTNFQAPIDYASEHQEYDGLIIITDGYAPTPELPPHFRTKVLWVIDNEEMFRHCEDLRKTGRVCLLQN